MAQFAGRAAAQLLLLLLLPTLSLATAALTFTAHTTATSQPIPASTFPQALRFFQSRDFCEACLRSRVEPLTPKYEALWHAKCGRLLAPLDNVDGDQRGQGQHQPYTRVCGDEYLPTRDSRILRTCTTMSFPGLMLKNTVVSGLVTSSSRTSGGRSDVLRGILLAEERTVSGPAARLFDALMGHATTTAISTMTLLEEGNHKRNRKRNRGTNSHCCVHHSSTVTVEIDVPVLLLRMMPLSVDKMEALGSASVQSAVTSDIELGMGNTSAAFKEWKESSSSSATASAFFT